MNIIVKKCWTELIKNNIITKNDEIQDINFSPKFDNQKYDLAIRVNNCSRENKKYYFIDVIIEECNVTGFYINIKYNFNKLFELLEYSIKEDVLFNCRQKSASIIIEHTSLTPVYPINLSTFRSSVIGNALYNLFLTNGYTKLRASFFVDDKARNFELINKLFDPVFFEKNKFLNYNRWDNIIGELYITSVLYSKNKYNGDSRNSIKLMYPNSLITDKEMNDLIYGEEIKNSNKKMYLYKVLEGYDCFFDDYNINKLEYHFASSFSNSLLDLNNDNGQYFKENYAYYDSLIKNNNIVISIVNKRHSQLLLNVKKLINSDNLEFVFTEDICFLNNESIEYVDKISDVRFHSVDNYINLLKKNYPDKDDRFLKNALMFDILSYNVDKKITYNEDGYINFNSYEEIVKILNLKIETYSILNKSKYETEIIEKILCYSSILNKSILYRSPILIINYMKELISLTKNVSHNSILIKFVKIILRKGLNDIGIIV